MKCASFSHSFALTAFKVNISPHKDVSEIFILHKNTKLQNMTSTFYR